MTPSIQVKAMAGLAIAVLFWAVNTVVARGVVDHIPPMALSFFRWIVALVCLLPFALKPVMQDADIIRRNIWFLLLLAVPSVAVYNSVLYLGALYTTATNISLVVAAMPAVTLGFAWAINRERPRLLQIIGIAVALAGVVAIIAQGNLKTLAAFKANPGDLLILISITAWALYSVLLKTRPLNISPISLLMTTVVLGSLSILPFYLIELAYVGGFHVDTKIVGMFIYLGICPSILSYICWNHGVKIVGASVASVFAYLLPV
ncbi:MAG TPA: EamA family transporter, partial [Desulfobacteraceae bacterium]|nr:EamA family transporter [Desulfobacteraceae bacterium]